MSNPSLKMKAFLVACGFVSSLAVNSAAYAASAASKSDGTSQKKEEIVEPSATIGTITELARKVKIAELNKQLREANKVNSDAAGANTGRIRAELASPLPTYTMPPPQPPVKVAVHAPVVAQTFAISSISGRGDALVAQLSDGRTVKPKDSFTFGGEKWNVNGITAQRVEFRVCDSKDVCRVVPMSVS